MKNETDIDYYELLEIPYDASSFEIRQAYKDAFSIYNEDSLATYSFFEDGERDQILKKIEETKGPQAREPLRDWLNFKEIAGETRPLDYDPSQAYGENQALSHPTFGLGFVRKVIDSSKVEVVFEREVKILVMNRPKSGQE